MERNKEEIIENVKGIIDDELKGKAVDVNSLEVNKELTKEDNDSIAAEIAQSMNVLLDKAPLEDQTEEELHTGINEENEQTKEDVSIDGRMNDIMSVFGDTRKQIRDMNIIRNSGGLMISQINEMAVYMLGIIQPLTRKDIEKINSNIAGRKIEDLTEEQMNEIVSKSGFTFKEVETKEGVPSSEPKRYFLGAIVDFIEGFVKIDEAEAEFHNVNRELQHQFDELLTDIDLTKELSLVQQQIENTTDKKEKARLNSIYQGIYSVINIEMYFKGMNLKPINILRREADKNYDHIKKKARSILKNDKKEFFLDIKLLDAAMNMAFPDLVSENKIFLYLFFKKIIDNKRKPDITFNTFINYFVLTISKIVNESFKDDPKYKEIKSKIRVALERFTDKNDKRKKKPVAVVNVEKKKKEKTNKPEK